MRRLGLPLAASASNLGVVLPRVDVEARETESTTYPAIEIKGPKTHVFERLRELRSTALESSNDLKPLALLVSHAVDLAVLQSS